MTIDLSNPHPAVFVVVCIVVVVICYGIVCAVTELKKHHNMIYNCDKDCPFCKLERKEGKK